MPKDLLFTVSGSTATVAQVVTLADVGLRERHDLQEWVLAYPAILGDDILIVTLEFDRWWSPTVSPADRLDVLGLGADGRLVVAELKRDKAPDTVEMQAIKYAAMASRFTQESLAEQYARFLNRDKHEPPTSEDAALERLVAHAGELDPEVLRRPRIAIVAGEFPPVLTATTVWLTEMGLDVTLVRVQAFRTEHETLVTVSQIFPVKDVEEFTVTPRQAEVKAVDEKRERQKDVNTTNRLLAARVLEDGTPLLLRPEGVNSDIRTQIAAWVEADETRGRAQWSNDPGGGPLIWESDGQRYSPSGLAVSIVQKAGGLTRSIRGGDWWVTEDGSDLVELARVVTSREGLYLEFWTKFAECVRAEHLEWIASRGKPAPRTWFEMSSRSPGAHFQCAFKGGDKLVCELYIDTQDRNRNAHILAGIASTRVDAQAAFGEALEWNEPNERHRYASVSVVSAEGNVTETERHDEFMQSLIDTTKKLRGVLEGGDDGSQSA